MTEKTYQVILSIEGQLELIVKAENENEVIDSAQARTANIERHLQEKLNSVLDVEYNIETVRMIDTIEGDEDVKSKKH